MVFYTVILKKSSNYWVALCLENEIIGQGQSQDGAIAKLKEAIESFQEVHKSEVNIYHTPISNKELHEFIMIETEEPTPEYQLRAVYA